MFSEPLPCLGISCLFNACSQTQWAAESISFCLKFLFTLFWQKSISFTKLSQVELCAGIPEGKGRRCLAKYSLSKISPSPLAMKQSLLVMHQRKKIPVLKEKHGANSTTPHGCKLIHLEPFLHYQNGIG